MKKPVVWCKNKIIFIYTDFTFISLHHTTKISQLWYFLTHKDTVVHKVYAQNK
jgi:hypothetical protein